MELPTAKQLSQLAKACRKLGVRRFKSAAFEFELTDEAPAPKSRKNAPKSTYSASNDDGLVETDSLSPEQLLNWNNLISEDTQENA